MENYRLLQMHFLRRPVSTTTKAHSSSVSLDAVPTVGQNEEAVCVDVLLLLLQLQRALIGHFIRDIWAFGPQ